MGGRRFAGHRQPGRTRRGTTVGLTFAATVACLAAAPCPAGADLAAIARTTLSAGPALAGQTVVWGAPAGGRSFSVREAAPGHAPATVYAAPVVPPGEQIAPLGLDGSPTSVAVAYETETDVTGDAEAASPLTVDALGGPLAGPLRALAHLSVPTDQNLDPAAIGLTGDDVVLAEPVDQFGATEHAHVQSLASDLPPVDIGPVGIDGLAVTGSYIASSSSTHAAPTIAVTDLAGAAVYSVAVTESAGPGLRGTCQSGTRTEIGFAACGFALGADGTLAIAVETTAGTGTTRSTYRLYWASPAQPQLHPIAPTAASSIVAIADDQILYVAAAGPHGEQLALTDLAGATRPISFAFPGDAVSGLAFDGQQIAFGTSDCVYGGTVPTSAPAGPPAGICSQDELTIGVPPLARGRVVPVRIACQMAAPTGCSGTLTLTARFHPRHGRTKTRTLASGTFTVALGTARTVRLKVPAARLAGLPVIRATTFNSHRHPRAVVVNANARTTDAAGLHKAATQQLALAL